MTATIKTEEQKKKWSCLAVHFFLTARSSNQPSHPSAFRSHEQFSSPHHYSAMFTIKYLFGG